MGKTKSLNQVFLLAIFSLFISCSLPDEAQLDQNIFLSYVDSKSSIIVDVRTPEEYIKGHFEGCATLDFYDADFYSKFKFIGSHVCLVLYCNDGLRSSKALKVLKDEYGFSKIFILRGGINGWPEISDYFVTDN